MNIFKKIAKRFKPKNRYFKALIFTVILAVIGTSLFVVYGQSLGTSSGGPSLTKGLVAHWTLDAEDYEEGTENLLYDNGNINWYISSYYTRETVISNYRYKIISESNSHTLRFFMPLAKLSNGETYTMSYKYKINSGDYFGMNDWNDTKLFDRVDIGDGSSDSYSAASGVRAEYNSTYRFMDFYISPNTEVEIWDFQLEKKDHATPFVNGSRQDRVVDKTPYSNHGVNYGATPTTDRHGKEGGAMSFDGESSGIEVSSFPMIFDRSVTLSTWANFTDSSRGIILGSYSTANAINFEKDNTGLRIYWNNGEKNIYAYNAFELNKWNHIVLIRNKELGRMEFWVNGELLHTVAGAGSDVTGAQQLFRIGRDSRTGGTVTKGSYSDMRIYDRALSAEEISLLYDSYQPKVKVSSINAGLIGHWSLSAEDYNTTTNRVTDKTPYENHGTNYGANFTTDRNGKIGGAMSFDGSSNNINCSDDSNSFAMSGNSFSMGVWAQTNGSPSTYNYFISFGNSSAGNQAGLGITTSNRLFLSAYSTPIVTTSYVVQDVNNWHHYFIVYNDNNDQVKFFVDGVLKEVKTIALNTTIGKCRIGSHVGNGAYFNGKLSDVRIYNRTLSDEEINLLYSSYNPQTGGDSLQKGLVLDMPLTSQYVKTETSGSQVVTDKTPSGNDGKNYGASINEDSTIFNGINQYIDILSVNKPQLEPSSITVSSWINMDLDASTIRHIFLTKWNGYSFEIEGNTRIPYLRLAGLGDIRSTKAITLGKWHHLVGSYDPISGGTLYLDGELVGSMVPHGNIIHSIGSPLNIGRYVGGVYFKGNISNVRIYSRSLPEDEVKLLYTQGAASLGGIPTIQKSCKKILEVTPSSSSGVYQIQPIPEESPFSVYCDMTTDDGGWTLVEKDYGGSATVPVSSVNDTNTSILLDQTWSTAEGKFADSKFKAIWLSGDRELLWRKSTGENVKMRFSTDFINNHWFSNFTYSKRPAEGVIQEFYRYSDNTWYGINGHSNNWHFSNYSDSISPPYSTYRMAKDQNDNNTYWPTRSDGLMDTTSWMFHMYIR